MKCLQIVGDSKYGGATCLMLEWSKYLVSKGCKVDVLSTDQVLMSELREIPGIRVIDNIFIPREIALVIDMRAFFQIFALLITERYEVVHTYTPTPSFLGRMAARLVGVPVIVNHQGAWTVTEYSPLLQRILYTPLEYLAVLASTKTICVSHAEAQLARKFHVAPQHKLVTILNGIDPLPFITPNHKGIRKAFRQELGIPDDYLVIGTTGRLAPQKDNQTLIRAMVNLKSIIPNGSFILLLAGDGPDKQHLDKLISSLDLRKHVRLLGFCRDIPAFLEGLDVFASPSLWEGMSLSLLEAMAAAKPIITTSILPNAELIEHEVTGLLVPPRSPGSIAKAIDCFVREPGLARRCASAARSRVLEHYTIDRMFQETWDLYISLLKEKRPESIAPYVP